MSGTGHEELSPVGGPGPRPASREENWRGGEGLEDSEGVLAAALDSLGVHLALLDEAGRILGVNAAWRRFARDNEGRPERTGVGMSYLEVCERAAQAGEADGLRAGQGVREVLAGARQGFYLEYPCHGPRERRWYALRVTRLAGRGAVVTHHPVTGRRLAEEALHEGEARFRALFEQARMGIGLLDTQGRVLESNPALRALVGHDEQALRGRRGTDFSDPDAPPERLALFEDVLVGRREGCSVEQRIRRADGALLWGRFTLSLVRGEDGAPRYTVVMVEDIGERKRAEEAALRLGREEAARAEAEAARERVARLLESITEPFLALDGTGRLTFVNRRAAEVLGAPREALLGRPWGQGLPALEGSRLAREVPRALATRRPAHFEEYLPWRRAWLEAHLSPSAEGLSLYLRDVTERRRAEEAQRLLAEASQLLAASLEYEPTLQGLVRFIVPRLADYCVVLLAEGEELRPVALAHREPEREGLLARLKGVRPGGEEPRAGVRHVMRTGRSELVPVVDEAWLRALSAGSEELLRTVRELAPRSAMVVPLVARGRTLGGIAFNSTEPGRYGPLELALAEELAGRAALAIDNARLYRESRQASRMRDEVLAIVSHDLRNPLNTILLSAGLLRQRLGPGAQGARPLEMIERSAERAVRLIGDLLEVGRIQAGRLKVERAWQQPARLVEEAVELHRALAEARGLALEGRVLGAPPAVWADRERVQQVFSNLIGNALKATAPGGRIEVGARGQGRVVRFWVADTGRGIAPESLPRLFDWLWQARDAQGGVGLGLYICKGIVEAHGGRMRVHSTPGRGSTFSFLLPRDCSEPRPE